MEFSYLEFICDLPNFLKVVVWAGLEDVLKSNQNLCRSNGGSLASDNNCFCVGSYFQSVLLITFRHVTARAIKR